MIPSTAGSRTSLFIGSLPSPEQSSRVTGCRSSTGPSGLPPGLHPVGDLRIADTRLEVQGAVVVERVAHVPNGATQSALAHDLCMRELWKDRHVLQTLHDHDRHLQLLRAGHRLAQSADESGGQWRVQQLAQRHI